jgi:hypothetical protein
MKWLFNRFKPQESIDPDSPLRRCNSSKGAIHRRRNLTPEQKSYLRGKQYNLEKKAEGRPASPLLPHIVIPAQPSDTYKRGIEWGFV